MRFWMGLFGFGGAGSIRRSDRLASLRSGDAFSGRRLLVQRSAFIRPHPTRSRLRQSARITYSQTLTHKVVPSLFLVKYKCALRPARRDLNIEKQARLRARQYEHDRRRLGHRHLASRHGPPACARRF